MRQHDREKAGVGFLNQRAALLEHLCKIRHASPFIRCPLPLEICRALAIHQPLNIKGIAAAVDLEHSQISKCVAKLSRIGIVQEQFSGRETCCCLSDRCTCSRSQGTLQLSLNTPEGHRITLDGPDSQRLAPGWFTDVSIAAGDLLFPLNRCKVVMCVLSNPGSCVTEIAALCDQSLALTSHHLKKLRKAGMVWFVDKQQRHLFRLSTKCRPSGTPDSLHMSIQCEGDSHLSLSFQLDNVPHSPPHSHNTTQSHDHSNHSLPTKAPEIHTRPQSGKFARDK